MRNAFIQTMERLGENPRTMLLIADTGEYIMKGYKEKYGNRFINAGISEQNMVGTAMGLSLCGYTPFTYSISSFYARCYDQIRVDLCQHNANVKLVGIGSGLSYGTMGPTHHSIEDIAIMRALPNMTIFSPCDPQETTSLTEAAFYLDGPVYLRLALAGEPIIYRPNEITIGRVSTVRYGRHATILGTGRILKEIMQAAHDLEKEGVFCTVLNAHTLKPFDSSNVRRECVRTGIVVTVEEHNLLGGLGTLVAESLVGETVKMIRLGIKDEFCEVYGDKEFILNHIGISTPHIKEAVRSLLS